MINNTKYCIFIDTFCGGPKPAMRDETGNALVFETRNEAEREIVDNLQTRLQQFLDGERDFDDAITVEEYVVSVDVAPDGTVVPNDPYHPWCSTDR